MWARAFLGPVVRLSPADYLAGRQVPELQLLPFGDESLLTVREQGERDPLGTGAAATDSGSENCNAQQEQAAGFHRTLPKSR
jgi:hypothetical protein